MRKLPWRAILPLLAMALPPPAFAQFAIPHHVLGGGCGASSDGVHGIHATLGQVAPGVAAGTTHSVHGGFWAILGALHIGPASPVAVTEFEASFEETAVVLTWHVSDRSEVLGCHVYRATAPTGPFVRLDPEPLPPGERMTYRDRSIEPGRRYWYRVGLATAKGEILSQPLEALAPVLRTLLFQNTPNPFNPSTTIRFSLARSARVRVTILDPQGRYVRTLVDGKRRWGVHRVTWDGRDEAGRPVSSGVYFCRLEADGVRMVKKMVLLK